MSLLQTAVMTGDDGSKEKFIIIGIVCVVAIVLVAVLGFLGKKK